VENLEKVALYQRMVDLQNEASGLKGKIEAVLLRKGDFRLETPSPDIAGGPPVF